LEASVDKKPFFISQERTITPEQQITNVLNALESQATGPSYPDRMKQIRRTIQQLRQMWQQYQAGELEAFEDDGLPF
jgi:hypothetical protein